MDGTKNLSFTERIEFGLNLINHIFISFVSIYMSYVCLHLNLSGTALHAWLCALGYNLLMAEAIMSFFSGNIVTYTMQRKTKTIIHWVLQLLGGVLGIVGILLKIVDKKNHFNTTHGVAGLVALILTGISMLNGLSALYSIKLKSWFSPLINKLLHNAFGLGAFISGMIAMYYGYNTGFFIRKVEPDFADIMRAFTILTLILSSWGGVKALLVKIKSF